MSSLSGTRLALCALAARCGPGRLPGSVLPPGSLRCSRGLTTVAGQKRRPGALDSLDLRDMAEKIESCKQFRRFISDPELARTVLKCLNPWEVRESGALIMECNPGPGVFTRALLDAGARVAALESNTVFLPDLQALENRMDGQLEVVHCDFFKLDPFSQSSMSPPVMHSETLFETLGISEVQWTADVPIKVVGIFSQKNERNMLWKLIYSLYERLSVYRYGRVELNMFISEKQYMQLTALPGNMKKYQAISVMYQAACDIQLLHMEPWSSFSTSSKCGSLSIPKSVIVPNDHLCLVRITPRRTFFTEGLTPANAATFVVMVKQCLIKRKAKLVDKLESWNPGTGHKLLRQLDIPEDIVTGNVYPEEYKQLFEAMQCSEELNKSWIFDEVLENVQFCGY